MSKILKQKLIRGWCCALTMAVTMFLLGLHLSATAAMAQSGVQESALSASHHSSAPMVGGMVSATLLALIVIPSVFLLWQRSHLRRAGELETN